MNFINLNDTNNTNINLRKVCYYTHFNVDNQYYIRFHFSHKLFSDVMFSKKNDLEKALEKLNSISHTHFSL